MLAFLLHTHNPTPTRNNTKTNEVNDMGLFNSINDVVAKVHDQKIKESY